MTHPSPPIVCIIGRKNSGKTELTVALAAELNRRGLRVMTVKHGHGFQVDQPGRDSWRHRHEGGAVRTVLASPGDFAVIGAWPRQEMTLPEVVSRFLWDASLVLAEGFKASPEPSIEVFRGTVHDKPLGDPAEADRSGTVAFVTDQPDFRASVPVFRFQDPGFIAELADLVVKEVLVEDGEDLSGGGQPSETPKRGKEEA